MDHKNEVKEISTDSTEQVTSPKTPSKPNEVANGDEY
jgi:hypothetical protein